MKTLSATLIALLLAAPLAAGQASAPAPHRFQWRPLGVMPGAAPMTVDLTESPADLGRVYAASAAGLLVSDDAGLSWSSRSLPPQTDSDFAWSVTASPADADTILVSMYTGDLLRSEDAGQTWSTVLALDYASGVLETAFAPSDGNQAYAVTVDGVWRSVDAGQTFTEVLDGFVLNGGFGYHLVVDPFDPLHVYVLAFGLGLYVTTDGGTTWQIKATPQNRPGLSLAIDPASGQRILFGDNKIWLSEDGGDTWNAPGTGTSHYADAVAFDPNHTGKLYAGLRDRGLGISTDDGVTWSYVSDSGLATMADVVRSVLPSRNTPELLLLADEAGIFRSSDGGLTFTPSSAGLEAHATIVDIATDPFRPGYLVARTSGSVFRSADHGRSWSAATGLGHFAGFGGGFVADPLQPGRYYGGSRTGELYRSDDHGHSFAPVATLTDRWIVQIAPHPEVADRLFISTIGGGNALLRSDDGGLTFTELPLAETWSWSIAISPVDPDIMYASTTSQVFRSSDGGATWVGADLSPQGVVRKILPDPRTAERAYASSPRTGLYRTDDSGRTWQMMSDDLRDAEHLGIPPWAPDILVASNVWRRPVSFSADPDSWAHPLGFGLPSPTGAIAFEPGRILAGTIGDGVWVLR